MMRINWVEKETIYKNTLLTWSKNSKKGELIL
jgi:hypothetical protein